MKFCMKFGWNVMKAVEGVVFRKSWNRKCCKVHWMTLNQSQWIRHQKHPTYVYCSTPSPKFSSVSLYDHPIDSYAKISKCHENWGRSVLKFLAPYGPVLTKISKCHKFVNFWLIAKNSNSLPEPLFKILCMKFGWNVKKTVEGVVFRTSWNQKFFHPRSSGFWDMGHNIKIAIFRHESWTLAKVPKVAYMPSFSPRGSKLSLFSLYGQRFLRYGPIFKIAIFGHETWPLAKFPEVAHILSFSPRGSKLSLFSLYGQRFLRYGPIFKIAILGHETWPFAKVPEVAHIPSFYPRGSKLSLSGGWTK